jgi:hypothetical protein
MHIYIAVPGTEHEIGSELKRVLSHTMLPMSGRASASPSFRIIAPNHVQHVRCFQACSPIRNSIFIHQQRECDACFFPKGIRVFEIAEADRGELCSLILETDLVITQLRDVLATENSAVVAQEN